MRFPGVRARVKSGIANSSGDSVVVGLLHQVVGVPDAVQTGLLVEAGQFEQLAPGSCIRREDRELHRRTVPAVRSGADG